MTIIDKLAEPDIVKRLELATHGDCGPQTAANLAAEAKAEIERLRAALRYYADPENYDEGMAARHALEQLEQEGK